jgi:LysM repeat protein
VSAFEIYLRSGRRIAPAASKVETKFNPWHDPEDGRFTFAGQGRYHPGGQRRADANGSRRDGDGQSSSNIQTRAQAGQTDIERSRSRSNPRNPRNYSLYTVKRGDTLTKIARLRKGLTATDLIWLNELNADRALQIGQKIKLPHQQFLDQGKRARQLSGSCALHGGDWRKIAAQPRAAAINIRSSRGVRSSHNSREWVPV